MASGKTRPKQHIKGINASRDMSDGRQDHDTAGVAHKTEIMKSSIMAEAATQGLGQGR